MRFQFADNSPFLAVAILIKKPICIKFLECHKINLKISETSRELRIINKTALNVKIYF